MSATVPAFEVAPSLGEEDGRHGVDVNAVVSSLGPDAFLQSLTAADDVENGGAS